MILIDTVILQGPLPQFRADEHLTGVLRKHMASELHVNM